jgi:hypothetical protein
LQSWFEATIPGADTEVAETETLMKVSQRMSSVAHYCTLLYGDLVFALHIYIDA